MKKIILPCLLALWMQSHAQQTPKMDAQLKLWTSDAAALAQQQPALFKSGPAADPQVPVIFKTNGGSAATLVAKHKGTLHSVIGTICTADIPLSQLASFAAEPEIVKVESSKEMLLNNDKGRQLIGADKVSGGELPGGTAYTGKGVVVGIIDTGIDFLNVDFRKKTDATKTRILNIWDQTAGTGTRPTGYSYGAEWTQTQINNELTHPGTVTQQDSGGHGTHVSGTAAGLRGVAYDADIMMVKTPLVSNGDYKFATSAKTLDAVSYLHAKAAALGKPCVINMSLGFSFGAPHDGTSLFEEGIDNLVSGGNGFIVCASAGNEGQSFGHHGGYALTQDSVWTYVNSLNGATWYAVSESKYDDSIYVSVSIDSAGADFNGSGITGQRTVLQSPWMKLKDIRNASGGFTYAIINPNGDTSATLRMVAEAYDAGRTELYVYPRDRFVLSTAAASRVNLCKISFKGAGTFHSWYQALNGFAVHLSTFNAKTNARYRDGDNNYTIGIPATAKKVLAVGAYINKSNYVDIKGRTQKGLNTTSSASGAIATFSSKGPTLDNRMKPEFCAPGLNVASTLSRYAERDSSEMVDANTVVFSGTSMSCPFTVGALALFLEKFPQASFDNLRALIDSSAKRDAFTGLSGAMPNNTWGFGKLDIYKAMGGQFHTGIEEESNVHAIMQVYPNPASGTVTFNLGLHTRSTANVYDMRGQLVGTYVLEALQPTAIDITSFPAGMYFYRIEHAGVGIAGKFMVK